MPLDASPPVPNVPNVDGQGLCQALRINVRMPDGGWVAPSVPAGVRVLDALERFGLPLRRSSKAIRIGARWYQRVTELSDDEPSTSHRLDAGRSLPPSLLMSPDLDGLEIELGWDALEPQTYWIAG